MIPYIIAYYIPYIPYIFLKTEVAENCIQWNNSKEGTFIISSKLPKIPFGEIRSTGTFIISSKSPKVSFDEIISTGLKCPHVAVFVLLYVLTTHSLWIINCMTICSRNMLYTQTVDIKYIMPHIYAFIIYDKSAVLYLETFFLFCNCILFTSGALSAFFIYLSTFCGEVKVKTLGTKTAHLGEREKEERKTRQLLFLALTV